VVGWSKLIAELDKEVNPYLENGDSTFKRI